jgi:hypothetical protein
MHIYAKIKIFQLMHFMTQFESPNEIIFSIQDKILRTFKSFRKIPSQF